PIKISRLQAMRTPWFRNTLLPKLRLPPAAQEISTMLCARDRMVRPSPTEMAPLELISHGPSTARRAPADAQCFRKRQLHHRILRLFHTLHKQTARRWLSWSFVLLRVFS